MRHPGRRQHRTMNPPPESGPDMGSDPISPPGALGVRDRNGTAPAILLTGATGFLGRHVVGSLRARVPNARLFSLTRDPVATVGADDGYVREVIPIEGSPLTADHLRTDARLERLDAIVHLAGQVKHSRRDEAEMVRFNVQRS